MAIDQKVRFCYYLGAESKDSNKSKKQHHFSSWPMYIVYAQLGGVWNKEGYCIKQWLFLFFVLC